MVEEAQCEDAAGIHLEAHLTACPEEEDLADQEEACAVLHRQAGRVGAAACVAVQAEWALVL